MLQFFSIHIFKYYNVYGVLWKKKKDVFTKILVPAISQELFAKQIKDEDKFWVNINSADLFYCLGSCVHDHHCLFSALYVRLLSHLCGKKHRQCIFSITV